MNHGELSARHFATGLPVCARWRDGVLTVIDPAPAGTSVDHWIAPPLFDPQVNGYGGVDFQRDDRTTGELLKAVRALRSHGCTRILLTLITDEWSRLIRRLQHLKALRDASDELRAGIAGWHIEGPFLSPEPGFHGAHNPAVMIDPKPEHVHELRAVTGNDPVLLTIAPERNGGVEAVSLAVSLGLKVSIGHSNAPKATLDQCVAAGATGFTHLGNACPHGLNRHDNVLWRVIDSPGLTAGLIPDKLHVPPMLFRVFHRALDPERIYYTTDAMSAAGAPPGRYTIGAMEMEVGADQIVRQPGKTNFAGSALRPIDGVFRAAEMLGCSWREVWPRFSHAPAKLMGLANELAAGAPADFCVLTVSEDNQLTELRTYVRGETA